MDKESYIRLLKGEGKQYKNSRLYVLSNKASTVEERAAQKICPPPTLDPNYAQDPRIRRVGKITPRNTQKPPQSKTVRGLHPEVLKFINGE